MDSVSDAFEKSVERAVSDGIVDRERDAALIEAARKLAWMMDTPEWPIVNGKLDNVSPSAFLKYCDKLHIGPLVAPKTDDKPKPNGLTVMVNRSKYSKQAANA